MTVPFLTGSYARPDQNGICRFELDTDSGSLMMTNAWKGFSNPSYVIGDQAGRRFYIAEELCPEGNVVSVLLKDDLLTVCDRVSSFGADPCHLCLWPDEKTLAVCNYTDGSFSVYRVEKDGRLQNSQKEKLTGGSVNKSRQECAHMHFSAFRDHKVWLIDLGTDRVYMRSADERTSFIEKGGDHLQFPPGTGPRHLAFGEDGVVYIVSELQNQVYVYMETREGYRLIQVTDTTDSRNEGLAAAVRYQNHRLFVSNRGEDSIVMYRADEDGRLTFLDRCLTGGKIPRDFDVIGDYIVVCNQESSLLTVLKLDGDRTRMRLTGHRWEIPRPTCICQL